MSTSHYRLVTGVWQSLDGQADIGGSPPPPSGVLYGVNAGNGVDDAIPQRLTDFGRLPIIRIYYTLNNLGTGSNLFNTNKEGQAPEQRAQVSFKVQPSDILSGSWDSKITSYVSSVPSGWQILFTYWHEPNSELNTGVFTATDYKNAWYRVSDLCVASGAVASGRVICALNYTGPQVQTGVAWSRSWIPDVSLMHTGTRLTWDAYGNLYGGTGYDSPYRAVSEPIDPCVAENVATGYQNNWGITEFNTPRRNFDTNEVQRAQWIQDYVDYCLALSKPPKSIILWEGNGVQFDQKFYNTNIKNKWRDISATST